jgi:hypothetical protein
VANAKDFYNRIIDEKEHPMFCSDKACFWDLYVGDTKEGRELIYKAYGVRFTNEELRMPFWELFP